MGSVTFNRASSVCLSFFLCAGALPGLALATSPAAPAALQAGHSAVWYDAESPGTGWVIEMLRNDRGAVYWYGFDAQGKPAWRFGAGTVEGNPLHGIGLTVPDLYAGSGARFGDAFDPNDVVLERVGRAGLSFLTCDSGHISVDLGAGAQTEPLDRLTRTMGAGCAPINGEPGYPVKAYAGQSGSWYNPDRDGEGFSLQWMSRDEAVLYWFTYDLEGNPFWLFGVGTEQDGAIVFPVLHSAERSPKGEVSLTEWGSLELELECNTGTMHWASLVDGYGEGSRDLNRLNRLASPACPTVRPMLTDLYDIDARMLSVPPGRYIYPKDIADDGTVLGTEQLGATFRLVSLSPEPNAEWRSLGGPIVDGDQPVFLAADATQAVASELDTGGDVQPLQWTVSAAGAPLPDFPAGVFRMLGASVGREVLTGTTGGEKPWVWDALGGARTLPLRIEGDSVAGAASAAADDAGAFVGHQRLPVLAINYPVRTTGYEAMRWKSDGTFTLLRDAEGYVLVEPVLCNADCSVVYGVDSNGVEHESSRVHQPWVWTTDRRFEVLEGLEYQSQWLRHRLADTSSDGTIVMGTTVDISNLVNPVNPIPKLPEGFAWTQATGLVELDELLIELGVAETTDSSSESRAMTSDGRQLLLYAHHRWWVLTLTPKGS